MTIHSADCKCFFCVDTWGQPRRDKDEINPFGVCPLCSSPLSQATAHGFRVCMGTVNPKCHYAISSGYYAKKLDLEEPECEIPWMTDAEWDEEPSIFEDLGWLPEEFFDAEEFYEYHRKHNSWERFLEAVVASSQESCQDDDW